MSEVKTGRCHCGVVEFEVKLANGLEQLRRCNCSLCSRKGAIMAGVPVSDLTVTKGKQALSLYQWNMKIAKHYFCKHCGIYTHHQRRSNPKEFGFNVACLDGIRIEDFSNVEMMGDGRSMSLAKDL